MKLTKKQKEFVLTLVAEGLESDEINAWAAKQKPPFSVSRQQVDHYRETRSVRLKEIAASDEFEALRTGLALRSKRVARLEALFDKVERDLFKNNLIWLKRERALGSGVATKFVVVEELNTAQIAAYRALLDDIAKEMNQRTYAMRDSLDEEDDQPTGEVKVTVAYEEKPKEAIEE
jgi:hypothetical protein